MGREPLPDSRKETGWLLLGLAFVAAYAWGALDPEGFHWGGNALAFFPPAVAAGTLALAVLLLVVAARGRRPLRIPGGALLGRIPVPVVALLGAGLALVAFLALPIQGQLYGDSLRMGEWHGNNEHFDFGWVERVLDPNPFHAKESLTILVHRTASFLLDADVVEVYRKGSAVWGALFVGAWIAFSLTRTRDTRARILLVVAGVFGGAGALFFGQVENYAFAFLTWSTYLFLVHRHLDGRLRGYWLILPFLVALRSHFIFLCLFPATLYLILHDAGTRFPRLRPLTTGRGTLLVCTAPFLVAGPLAYVFLFGSHDAKHWVSGGNLGTTFLPVVPGEPPWDRYTLQSLNHLGDLTNLLLLVAVPSLALVLGIVLLHRREIPWSEPRIRFSLLAAGFCLLFFSALNPLLGMIRDWDLMSLVAVPVPFLLAAIAPHVRRVPRTAVALAVSLALFPVSFVLLNANPARESERFLVAARHVYRTYYSGAGYMTSLAARLHPDRDRGFGFLQETVRMMRDEALAGKDDEFSYLLYLEAQYYLAEGDTEAADRSLIESIRVSPNNPTPWYMVLDNAIDSDRPDLARQALDQLLRINRDDYRALSRAVVLATIEGDGAKASHYLERLRPVAPDSALVERLEAYMARVEAESGGADGSGIRP